MYLPAHVALGAAIGVATGNVYLAAIFSFASHFVLDHVKHWQAVIGEVKKVSGRALYSTLINVALTIVLVLLIARYVPTAQQPFVWVGSISAVLPDLNDVLNFFKPIAKTRAYQTFQKWHSGLNRETHKFWRGFLPQLGVVIVSLIVIYFFI